MYSSFGSFYIPVIILVAVYAKIYSITIQHNRNRLRETERLDKTLKLGLNKGGMMREFFLAAAFDDIPALKGEIGMRMSSLKPISHDACGQQQ